MAFHSCKYCGTNTDLKGRVCFKCVEKRDRIRTIKAMLMPYYLKKKERERKNENKT